MALNRLPDVDRIRGLLGEPHPVAQAQSHISLQYTDSQNAWHELKMPALDALYLLTLLETWAKDAGIEHLRRRPPSPG